MNYLDFYTPCELNHPEAQRFGHQFIRPKFGKDTLGMMLADLDDSNHEREVKSLRLVIENLRSDMSGLREMNDKLRNQVTRYTPQEHED